MSGFDPYGRRRGNIPLGEDVSLGPLSPRRIDPPLAPTKQGYYMQGLPLDARRKAAEKMGLPQGPSQVAARPAAIPNYRPNAGALSNNRGASKIVSPPAGGASVTTTIAETSRAESDAENIVITLGIKTSPDPNDEYAEQHRVQALITWGMGGATFSALVDWQQGKVLSLPASYVRVDAIYTRSASFGGTATDLLLSVGFGYGAASSNTAQYTEYGPTIESAATANTIRVPDFAKSVSFFTNVSNPNLQIDFYADWNNTAGEGTVRLFHNSGTSGTAFKIPNSLNWYTITNIGAAQVKPMMVFELGF